MRAKGYKVFTFDSAQGRLGDLQYPSVRQRLRHLVSSGSCLGILVNTPGTIFSGSAQPAIRNDAHPTGVDGLEPGLQSRVASDNVRADGALVALLAAHAAGVPFMVLTPTSSWFWKLPRVADVERLLGVAHTTTTFCAWGARWMKPTRITFSNVNAGTSLFKRCRCVGGVCSFSGRPHIHIVGRDAAGHSWGLRSRRAPPALSAELADLLDDAARWKKWIIVGLSWTGRAADDLWKGLRHLADTRFERQSRWRQGTPTVDREGKQLY